MNNETDTATDEIAYSETGNALTITIIGKPLTNLRAIADAMNSIEWCDNDNTASTVLDGFIVGDLLHRLGQPTAKWNGITHDGVGEITDLIVDGIETDCEPDSPKDKERRAALRATFDKFGV